MVNRVDVKYIIPDARGEIKKKQFQALGLSGILSFVEVRDSYLIDAELDRTALNKAGNLLANALIEKSLINKPEPPKGLKFVIEIGFLPGVTDNVGNTVKETIEDLLKKKFKKEEAVYSSNLYFVGGQIKLADAKKIADSLYNPLIQRAVIKSAKEYIADKGMGRDVPKVKLEGKLDVSVVDLNISDEELEKIGKLGIENSDGTRRGPLALNLEYLKTIQNYFNKIGRKPTDIELESIAQTWSEHCKHTIFADPIDELKDGLYKSYIKKATEKIRQQKADEDFCLSVFSDNSGGIEFDDEYLITHKVETHNSPSALDPFGGAVTGIVGVNRDTIGFGLGAKPIINTYGFCLADPSDKRALYRDKEKQQKMLPPGRIMQGVVQGVNVGGNCSGIPTAQGFLYFDERFRGKPLVFVGTVGIMPKKLNGRKLYTKKAEPGDFIVMVGGRVGQDGIHGATFSSVAMDSGSPATAVQIGDPITQKKFSDAIVKEARDRHLYNSITDNGAGGLSCSVAEMAKETDGCLVELDKVPLKYPGLEPWKIWVSESQERMTLAVPKRKWQSFKELMSSRGVEATVIGHFDSSGYCRVKYAGKTIMNLKMHFLHSGLPQISLKTKKIKISHSEPPHKKRDLNEQVLKMIKRLNLCSYDYIAKQYDHEVKGASVLKPVQGRGRVNAEAAVVKGRLDSDSAVVLSYGLYPGYSDIDTYHMAAASIDSAVRNAVAAGASLKKLAILDNFCWCSSDEPEKLYQIKEAAKACYDMAVYYQTPFISGKDSMFNDFKGFDEKGKPIKISIPPTLLVTSIAVVPDIYKTVSIDLKSDQNLIYLIGETKDELGASEYFKMLSEESGKDWLGNKVPKVNLKKNKKIYNNFYKAIQKDLVASSIGVGHGGFISALTKMAIAGDMGAQIKLPPSKLSDEQFIFSESQGRIIAEVYPQNKALFEKTMKDNKISLIGRVSVDNNLVIKNKLDKTIINIKTSQLAKNYRHNFKDN